MSTGGGEDGRVPGLQGVSGLPTPADDDDSPRTMVMNRKLQAAREQQMAIERGPPPLGNSRDQSPEPSETYSPLPTGSQSSQWRTEAHKQAQRMEDLMVRNQERNERSAKSRETTRLQDAERLNLLASWLEENDVRAANMQREKFAEQRRRAFIAEQRRSEQRKVWRELQRDEERTYLEYYSKAHKSSESKPSPSSSPRGGHRRPRTSPPVAGYQTEEIYRDMIRSHKGNANTMVKWKDFVAENERRSEAHWKKTFGGSDRSMDKLKGKLLKRTVRNIMDLRKVVKTFSGDKREDTPEDRGSKGASGEDIRRRTIEALEGQTLEDLSSTQSRCDSQGSDRALSREASIQDSRAGSPNATGLFSTMTKAPKDSFNAKWQSRMEGCNQKYQSDWEQKQEFLAKKKAAVEDSRRRKAEENKLMSERAAANVIAFERRKQEAALRRNVEADYTEMIEKTKAKMMQSTLNREELQASMVERAQDRAAVVAETKAAAATQKQLDQEVKHARHADKSFRSKDEYLKKLEDFETKVGSTVHAEKTAAKKALKAQLDVDIRKAAEEEIAKKAARTNGALRRVKSGAFELSRDKVKDKRAAEKERKKAARANDDELFSQDGSQDGSPKSAQEPQSPKSLPEVAASSSAGGSLENTANLTGSSSAIQSILRGSPNSGQGGGLGNSFSLPALSGESPAGGRPRRPTDGRSSVVVAQDDDVPRRQSYVEKPEPDEEADEEEFLTSLASQSTKWLHTMRNDEAINQRRMMACR
eukprot:gnl/TRDRNA2_/TRDRNA2_182773_c0_seq1.p1 gnl/TRDRNA2_/TRDRNA2_182773_c0~~gnl/TRDRNA2_/TRDRNA2_182773_c0_seq1.p1  ORF type:complete len:759 (+),score=183.58 gnl/TRDRNA2_/TRDRNA2_182773_c0_seq1:128-2404(+)